MRQPSQRPRATQRPKATQRQPLDIATQFVLVFACVLLYFLTRGITQGSFETAAANAGRLLELEDWLGIDVELKTQALTLDHHNVVTFFNWIYIWGHWPVITVVLIWLFRSHRSDYLVLRNAMFVSGAIGLVIFALFPVAPPRLLTDDFVDTVTEWSRSYRVLQPPALVNKYAAMPSLHVGWNLIVGIAVYRVAARRPARLFGVLSPVLMSLAVVVTANHYVVDALAGAALASFGLMVSIIYALRREWGQSSAMVRSARTGSSTITAVTPQEASCDSSDRSVMPQT